MNENIDIVIRDDGARVVKRNIEEIGTSAERSAVGVDGLKRSMRDAGTAADNLKKAVDGEIGSLRRQLDLIQRGNTVMQAATRVRLENMGATQKQVVEYERLTSAIKRAQDAETSSQRTSRASADGAGLLATRVGALAAAYISLQGAQKLAQQLDLYTKYNAQLALATDNEQQLAKARQDVERISARAQTSLIETGTLYARLNNALRELGKTQQVTADVSEVVALSLKVSGATAGESASAILQLSQAFGSGVLRGEEFNAVNEAAPRLMKALAEGMGVPIGALRSMAAEGQITAEVMADVLPKALEQVRKEAEKMRTIGGSVTELKNEIILGLGDLDKVTSMSTFVATGIDGITKSISILRSMVNGKPIDYSNVLPNGGQALVIAGYVPGGIPGVSAKGDIDTRPKVNTPEQIRAGNIIPSGLSMGVTPRTDYGTIEEAAKRDKALKAEADRFIANNPIKDRSAALEEYKSKLEQVQRLEYVMGPGVADRIRDQLKADLDKTIERMDKVKDKSDKLTADQKQSLKELQNEITNEAVAFTEAQEAKLKAQEEFTKGLAASRSAVEELLATNVNQLQTLKDQIEVEKGGVENVRKLELARLDETAAAYEQNAAWAIQNNVAKENIEYIEQQAQAFRELAATRRKIFAGEDELKDIKEKGKALKDLQTETERNNKQISEAFSKSLTDAIFRGFESGKGFAENFKETLINSFKTLILRPSIEYIVKGTGIASLFSGGTAAAGDAVGSGGGGFGGILAQGKTLFNGITQGFDKLNFGVTSSIEKLGVYLSSGNGGLADKLGGFLGQYSNQIATGLAFAPAVISLLKGDVKSAAFQGAGAGIGFAIGGPVGAGIGSFIGGAVGGLFGGKKQPRRTGAYASASMVNGQLTSSYANPKGDANLNTGIGEGLQGAVSRFSASLSALLTGFGGDGNVSANGNYFGRKHGSAYTNFNASFDGSSISLAQRGHDFGEGDLNAFMQDIVGPQLVRAIMASGIPAGIKALFAGMTDNAQINTLIQATVNLNSAQKQLADRFGLTVDQAGRVAAATGMVGDALAAFVSKLGTAALSFKTPVQSLLEARDALTEAFRAGSGTATTEAVQSQVARQVTERQLVRGFNTMGGFIPADVMEARNSINPFNTNSLGASNSVFNNLPGNAWGYVTATKTVFDTITSYVTKLLPSTKALPTSLDEFDSILKEINKTTAGGIEQFNKLFAIRDQFAAYTQAMDAIKDGVKGAVFQLKSPSEQLAIMQADLAAMFAKLNLTVPASAQELLKMGENIDYTTEAGLNLAVAFPSLVQAFQQVRGVSDQLTQSLNGLSESNFKTLSDWIGYKSVANNYGAAFANSNLANIPSLAVGTNYLPTDMLIQAHQGERIMPAADNSQLMAHLAGDNAATQKLVDEVVKLREETRAANIALAQNTQKTALILQRWNGDGMPDVRDVTV